jgi:hypothetical protein
VSNNKAARRSFWLIATRAPGRMEVFTIDAGSMTVLPTSAFRRRASFSSALRRRRRIGGQGRPPPESLLCARVDKVALDPLPGLGRREIIGLVSAGRRHFARHLMSEVVAHSEHKNPFGPETGRSDPARLWKGRTRPAHSVAR